MRHDTRQLCEKRARHGAHPHQLAWFYSAAMAEFCTAVDMSVSNRNRGSPLSKWQWSKTVLGIARRADVPGFSTHSLRHLRLTHLAQAGWRVHEIAIYAGHRNPQTTMTYLHISGSDLAARIAHTIQPRDEIIDGTLFRTQC